MYSLTYEGLTVSLGKGERNLLWQAMAAVSVQKDGKQKPLMTTEKRMYVTGDLPMTEVGIRSSVREDLYLILSALDDMEGAVNADSNAQGIDLQVLIKPFVGWIWFGGFMLAIGTFVALWPSVDRRRVALERRTERAPEPAMAAAD